MSKVLLVVSAHFVLPLSDFFSPCNLLVEEPSWFIVSFLVRICITVVQFLQVSPALCVFCKWRHLGSSGGSDGKESACRERDLDLILRQEDPLEQGIFSLPQEYPLQYSCLEISMDRSLAGFQAMGSVRVKHN
ncbi:unnamed protein product [Rangifer tarandus platyrhynchus]|uniref:Uncharacterized protein n=2 Tax=Rangifer tarandus platyrhynchus TaxID=3082113 RepID=A0ABN8YZ53_RANTA|nr:unnamed protein product [Rangifer tarandus platyrhynchus]